MDKNRNEYGLDLGRHKRHHRKFPWGFIRKMAIALILLGLLIYLKDSLKNKTDNVEEIEVEIDTTNNELEESLDL